MSRRGKKMGVFNVHAKDSSQPLADVEYRFDSKQGVFFAEFSDQEFENPSREALRAAVEECVRSRHSGRTKMTTKSRRRGPGFEPIRNCRYCWSATRHARWCKRPPGTNGRR